MIPFLGCGCVTLGPLGDGWSLGLERNWVFGPSGLQCLGLESSAVPSSGRICLSLSSFSTHFCSLPATVAVT